jgi:hypothetical protein
MRAPSTQPRIFVLAAVSRAALCSSAREVQPDLVKGTGIEPESARGAGTSPPRASGYARASISRGGILLQPQRYNPVSDAKGRNSRA